MAERIDYSKCKFADKDYNALEGLEPLKLPDEIINGNKKIVVKKGEKTIIGDKPCVKLEISY